MSANLRLEVAHAVLYVHDLDLMLDFYVNTLGFAITDRGPLGPKTEIVFLSQSADHHQVAFMTGRAEPKPSNSTNHIAFRSAGTLDDLRALRATLAADPRVRGIMPLTHGNAWSVYFNDPEFNGVEVFIDSPWHVQQPQGLPIDFDKSNAEIEELTRAHFSEQPGFGPIDAFYASRASAIAEKD